jgi:DHA1 family bicyclomycin/chloramphenicol resistance-like MFS transporter
MASVMSLTFMVFMAIPIIAPSIGQLILLAFSWHYIFLFMVVLAGAISIWAWFRLPETLRPEYRRPLKVATVVEGFHAVFTNRVAICYGLCGMFLFAGMFGFIISSQQIFVNVYGLGPYFPIAFACVAGLMAVAQFTNSRIVKIFGMRRISHTAIFIYLACGLTILTLSVNHALPFWAFFVLLSLLQVVFAWASSNMNSLSMEPLGAVAGTAAAVFGFMQTVGGAIIGTFIGQQFNGTLTVNAIAWVTMGVLVLGCTLIAEKGRLFQIGKEYQSVAPALAE